MTEKIIEVTKRRAFGEKRITPISVRAWAKQQKIRGNGVEPMADKVAACVREVVAIANGDGTVGERRKAAEQRIAKLLKNEAEKTLSHNSVAQDLRDRLGTALNAEHDHDAREVLDKAIDLLRAQIGLG